MRVLHLDTGRTMRGGQWQALRLVEGLAAEGVEATLLARYGSPLWDTAKAAGCRVEPLRMLRAAKLARRHDLVHAHDARAHAMAALAGGAPLIVSRRVAFQPGGAGETGRLPFLTRWKYGRAARYIAISEYVRSVLIGRGVPAEKIAVVYDGVPLAEMGQASLPAWAGQEPCPTAFALAPANAMDPRKGASLAAEAARLAGIELKFSDCLERDLRGASLFLYITHSEGLGSAALLAMSAGVPVVASKVGGLPEAIRHGETGLLVENSPEAIATAIRGLLGDPVLAGRIGEAGRREVAARFTVGQMVRRTIAVYREALS